MTVIQDLTVAVIVSHIAPAKAKVYELPDRPQHEPPEVELDEADCHYQIFHVPRDLPFSFAAF